jgi:uncharacterized membrane protein
MRRTIVAVLLLLAASVPVLAQGTYTQIDYPGAAWTMVFGINTVGDVVGSYGAGGTDQHGFLLSAGVFTAIDSPDAAYTVAIGTNDAGQIVGDTDTAGFLYDIATQEFTHLSFPKPNSLTFAEGINNAGTIVGSILLTSGGYTVGFELTGTKYREIVFPKPKIVLTALRSINNSGASIAEVSAPHHQKSFVFAKHKFRPIVVPGISGAFAFALNDENSIAGMYLKTPNSIAGFVYQGGMVQSLEFPGQPTTYAYSINNAGHVAGTFYDSEDVPHGYIWTPPADAVPNPAEKTIKWLSFRREGNSKWHLRPIPATP